jgi:hypothetical protein
MEVPIGTEKTHHSLGLLEWLDKAVEQNAAAPVFWTAG